MGLTRGWLGEGGRAVYGVFVGSAVAESFARAAVEVRPGDFFDLRERHAPVVDLVRGAGHADVVVGD